MFKKIVLSVLIGCISLQTLAQEAPFKDVAKTAVADPTVNTAVPTIHLQGPLSGDVGESITISVTELPNSDNTKPLAEALKWLEDIKIILDPASNDETSLKPDLRFDLTSQLWHFSVNFTPQTPGDYVVMCVERPSLATSVCRVTVRGSPEVVPPKPVDPVNPVDPITPVTPKTQGVGYSIVIRKAEKLTTSQTLTLLRIRNWVDSHDNVQHYEFPPDAENPDGTKNDIVARYVDKIPEGAFYPYAFITQKDDKKDAHILWQGELKNADDVIKRLEEITKK